MEPLAASNQPLSLDDESDLDSGEDGIRLHSRLASAVDRLPKFMKAESVKNQIRKSPEGVSEEEMESTLPQGSLPEKGVVPKAQVQSLINQNGIKVERKVMGGASQEGSLAKAAREKYLAAENHLQSNFDKMNEDEYKIAKSVRNNSYDEMNATAGKPDELVQAEKDFRANRIGPRRDETDVRLRDLLDKYHAARPRYEQYSTPGGIPDGGSVDYEDEEGRPVKHIVPSFRLRHNGKLLGNLEKAKKEGMFLLSNQRK